MKKVFFAVTTDLTYDQRMHRICSSLAKNNYQILLIGRRQTGSLPLIAQNYQQHRLPCIFNKGKLFYLEYTLRLFLYLLTKPADAYCAADLDTALPMFAVAKFRRKPFIYDAHEYFPEMIEVVNRPLIKKLWSLLEGYIVPRTPYAYTVNQSLADVFFKKYQVPFAVIHNCTRLVTNAEIHLPERQEKYLLYQGAVNAGRGLETLLRAMPALKYNLYICGKGDELHNLQHICFELNIVHKVRFTGYMVPADLQRITAGAFLGVNLLENRGLSYYYSLGNKFFDYLHAGVPQLMVDFPEYRCLNDIYNVGRMVLLTPESIMEAITYLEQYPDHYNQLVENCKRARLQLNWQNEEKKLTAFYKNIWTPAKTS